MRRDILAVVLAAVFGAAAMLGVNAIQASARTPQIGRIVQITQPFDLNGDGEYLRVLAVNDKGEWFVSDPINEGYENLSSETPHVTWYQISNTTH